MNNNKNIKSLLPPLKKGDKTKRIGIDARFYGPLGKGLGRYTQEIVDNIIKLDQNNEYVIFFRRENFNDFKCDSVRVKKVLADIKWYGLAEQIIMPYYIWRERLDLMHFPHFNVPIFCPVKFVVTIHDLILIKFPTLRATTLGPIIYKIKNLAYKIVILSAVKRAKKVLAVSKFTKDDIVKQFKIQPDKVVVTYEGVAELSVISTTAFEPGEKSLKDESTELKGFLTRDERGFEMTNSSYLLYVGNAYPHKNLEGLIRVFSKILKTPFIKGGGEDLKLVLVGKEDYFYSRLKQFAKNFFAEGGPAVGGQVIFPGYVPDDELKALYSGATLYIFPSLYEGFGLPPLEAMAHGLPVVSSDKTCLPEILGEAALYFNPDDETDMKNKIELALADEKLRDSLRERGYLQAKKYSWRSCARETLEVYKNCL